MKEIFTFCLLVMLFALRVVAADGVAVKAARGSVEEIGKITGLHSCFTKGKALEVRLLEEDGSATVARNPVYPYLVITNNGSNDYFSKVWRLPYGVERVEKLEIAGKTAVITAMVDVGGRDHPRAVREIITAAWSADGKGVADVVRVAKSGVPGS